MKILVTHNGPTFRSTSGDFVSWEKYDHGEWYIKLKNARSQYVEPAPDYVHKKPALIRLQKGTFVTVME